jgi:hypothetical protein
MARQTRFELPVLPPAKGREPCAQLLDHSGHRGDVGRAVGGEPPAGVEVREDQRADLVAIGTGDDDVARIGFELRQQARAQRADIHPGAGGELEVLGDAAVEQQALAGIVGVLELERVTELVEPIGIEGGGGEIALAPIARHDVGAAQPRLELVVAWNELELHARHRHAHIGGVLALPHPRDRHRGAFGRAQAGQEHDALAAGGKRKLLHLVEHRLRQRRAREPEHFEPPEESVSQLRVRAQKGSSAS